MKPTHTSGPWRIDYQPDDLDSKQSILRIVDGSEASLSHPQGPLVIANLNVCAFAPHMDEPLSNACLMASAPALLGLLSEAVRLAETAQPLSGEVLMMAHATLSRARGGAL